MKRSLLFFALLCCSTAALRAQNITGAYNQDSCSEHAFHYSTDLTSSNYSQYSIEQAYGNGVKDTMTVFPHWQSYGAWFNYLYPTPGSYTAKAVLFHNTTGARVDSATQQILTGTCVSISGRIYADFNSNCSYNVGADSLLYMPLSIKVDSANIPVDTVYAYGYWSYIRHNYSFTPTTYRFTVLNPPTTFSSTCQTANSITVNYTAGSYANNDFGYTCAGSGFDLSGVYNAFLRTSNAGSSWISGWYTNTGCSAQSGTVTFKVSPKYSIVTANVQPTPTSISGNTITWNYTNLHVGMVRSVYIPVTANAVYQLGDTACNTMTINPTTGDANPANNVISRCDSLRTGFDPNDKSVSPSGDVMAGTTLTYLINFENLGNDTAFNIHVLDTLSPALDASSFTLLSASHAMRPMLIERAGMKIMKFDFLNIRLADKNQPARNKGYVRFSMKTKIGITNGTNIPNRAGIYFDFNPVVMTNTAMNRIGMPQSVNVLQATPLNSIHPNPAQDRLTITNADGSLTEAVLVTATGQIVRRWDLSAGDNIVRLDGLSAGLYFVQLHGAAGVQIEKLEKR